MPADVDRSVPRWPAIREDGITPAGFGNIEGNQPCFCTSIGYIDIYLPHSKIPNLETARQIFEGLKPEIEKIIQYGPHDRSAAVVVDGVTRYFWLKFVFGAIIPRELDHRPSIAFVARFSGQEELPPP